MTVDARPIAIAPRSARRRADVAPWRELLTIAPTGGLVAESWLDALLDRIEARP